MVQAVLFDLDGTLLNSEPMVIECFKEVFKTFGRIEDFTEDRQLEVFGPPLVEEMAKFFPDQDPEELTAWYRRYQGEFYDESRVQLMDGAKEMIVELSERYPLAVVSSRTTDSCIKWLERFGIRDCFTLVYGQGCFEKPKPDPEGILKACGDMQADPLKCVYMGDNASDALAANSAGCTSVIFLSNEKKRSDVEEADPDYVIMHVSELKNILEELEK